MCKKTIAPALFIAHGNPMNALEDNRYTESWRQLTASIDQPKAIMMISAHWETYGTFITANALQKTIHDFRGFPPALFAMQYPANGNTALALSLVNTLKEFDVQLTDQWGLDHGSWTVLHHIYPEADIPVLQLSLDSHKSGRQHWQLAQALASLRQQNILIIGSGNIVHNIAKWMRDPNGDSRWAESFNQNFLTALNNNDNEAIIDYQQHAYANDAVPSPEHYLPALYISAMRNVQDKLVIKNFVEKTIEAQSMTSFGFYPQ